MESLLIFLTIIFFVCFLLSWIIPSIFSPLFKNKLSKGKIRLVFGLSVIATFVVFGIISDSNTSPDMQSEESSSYIEEAEVVDLPEKMQTSIQEESNVHAVYDFEEKNFSIYDDFLKTKNEQLSRMDQIVNNLTPSRHQVIIKYIAPVDTTELDALIDIQNKLHAVEEKTNKENPLHTVLNEAISYYYSSAEACYNWLFLLPDHLEFSDNYRFLLWDNALVEKMSKDCGIEERRNGDKKTEELISLLKKNGYNENATSAVAPLKKAEQTTQVASYKTVHVFSGTGAKNSEPFTITGRKFRVIYDCVKKTSSSLLCQAVLKSPTDEVLYKEIVNTIGETQGETVFYDKGTFYVEATVMGGSFDITIEEFK